MQSQVAQLKASGANTFAIFAFGKFAIQAFVYANKLGWKPQIYVNDVASASSIMKLDPQGTAEGSISMLWGKDPATPKFANDPGVALAAKIIKKYVPGGNPSDGFLVAGMAEAFTFVDALKQAGKNLTRKGLMTAVTHLNEVEQPVPRARREGPHDADAALPDLVRPAAALARRPLGAVRRHPVRQAVTRRKEPRPAG